MRAQHKGKSLTVAGGVDVVRQFGHSDLEPGLDLLHDFLIGFGGHEGNGETLGSETTSTTKKDCESSVESRKRDTPTRHDEGNCRHQEGNRS